MTIRNILAASRPFLWVNTAIPFALGWLLIKPEVGLVFIIGFLFFLFPYNLMMYGINDIFDYESDIKNPRKASIEGAALRKETLDRLWKYIIGISVPFIVYLILVGSWQSTIVVAFSLFMVVAYSAPPFRFKEIPFLDSFTSSMHFVTPLLYGLILAGLWVHVPAVTLPHLYAAISAYVLWGMASHAFGAIQDIVFDREAHIASVATVMGARVTVWFSTKLYVLSGIIILASFRNIAGVLVAVSVILFAINTARFLKVKDATAFETRKGWRTFLVLSLAVGALLVTGFLYFYTPLGIARMPAWAPAVIAALTGLFFAKVTKQKS